jgi:hypothetical protein
MVVSSFGAEPIVGTRVEIDGTVHEVSDISAVVAVGEFLVIASDERSSVQVLLEVERGKSYRAGVLVNLADEQIVDMAESDDVELDLEGLAVDQRTVYVIGSHSRKRSKVASKDEQRAYAKNRDRITKTHLEHARNWLFRMELDEQGGINPEAVTRTSLRSTILLDPVLDRFWAIPGKENGVDIEGLAMRETTLFVGFRSPVLRSNWVPVLAIEYGESMQTQTRFVNLDGLGVRGMETVEDGLLLLAGPAGDAGGEFRVYLWNGEDMLPGTGGPAAELSCLAKIKSFKKGKPESIARIGTAEASWDVLIAFDGVKDKSWILGRFVIPRESGPAACK